MIGFEVLSEYSISRQVRFLFTIQALYIFAKYCEICDAVQFVSLPISPEGSDSTRIRR